MSDDLKKLTPPQIDMGAYRVRQIKNGKPSVTAWVLRYTLSAQDYELWALLQPGQSGGFEHIGTAGGALFFEFKSGSQNWTEHDFLVWIQCDEGITLGNITFVRHTIHGFTAGPITCPP